MTLARLLIIVFAVAFSNVVFAQKSVIRFSVVDSSGRFSTEIKKSDIELFIGQRKIIIDFLRRVDKKNLEIVIMIDASASQERVIEIEKKAALEFIDLILQGSQDRVAVVKFAGRISLEQDLTSDFDLAKTKIKGIEFEPPAGYIGGGIVIGPPPPRRKGRVSGSTSMWESLHQVLTAFSKINRTASTNRVIFLISDGVNTSGKVDLKDVVKLSKAVVIPVFALGIGDKRYDGVKKKNLRRVSSLTGGFYSVPKKGKYIL